MRQKWDDQRAAQRNRPHIRPAALFGGAFGRGTHGFRQALQILFACEPQTPIGFVGQDVLRERGVQLREALDDLAQSRLGPGR